MVVARGVVDQSQQVKRSEGRRGPGDRRVEEEQMITNEEENQEEEKQGRKDEEKEEEGMEVDERGLKRKPEEQLMPRRGSSARQAGELASHSAMRPVHHQEAPNTYIYIYI